MESSMFREPFRLLLLTAFAFFLGVPVSAQAQAREDQRAWSKLLGLAESLLGDGGLLAPQTDDRLDALLNLHAQFCRDVVGRPVSSERLLLVREALKLFLKQIPSRYQGSARVGSLQLIKDLVANRAVFVELLMSDAPSAVVEEQLLGYLERNGQLSYKESPVIPSQLAVPKSDTPMAIVGDSIRLLADQGAHGHFNRVIDAGETVTLNIPLKNTSKEPYRSTSGFLITDDKWVKSDHSEVVYCEKKIESGETVTFAPEMTVTPRQSFTFTVSPLCPDGHMIPFELLVMDSDHVGADFRVPFQVRVSNVGPLDFGSSRIDDDIPGPSDGNGDDGIDCGETIELVLAIQNLGEVQLDDVVATFFCAASGIQTKPGDDKLLYRVVPANGERPVASSFVFEVSGLEEDVPRALRLRILVRGVARGASYSWVQSRVYPVTRPAAEANEVLGAKGQAVHLSGLKKTTVDQATRRQGGELAFILRAIDGSGDIYVPQRYYVTKDGSRKPAFEMAWVTSGPHATNAEDAVKRTIKIAGQEYYAPLLRDKEGRITETLLVPVLGVERAARSEGLTLRCPGGIFALRRMAETEYLGRR